MAGRALLQIIWKPALQMHPARCALHFHETVPEHSWFQARKQAAKTTSLTVQKGKQKTFASKVARQSALGSQWLLSKLRLKQYLHPTPFPLLTHKGNSQHRSLPHTVPPRLHGEKLSFSTNTAKRETVLPQTHLLFKPGFLANRIKAGTHTTCFSTSQT